MAQEVEVQLDKIVVTEALDPQDSLTQPSEILSIKASEPQMQSAADVIQQAAGVYFRRFGGLEAATAVSIRGSSPDQVQIFLDGVPLQTASGQGVDLSQITAQSLSQIQIYKSSAPAELGGGAMGGAIHLKSKKIEKGLKQRYGLGFGSFWTWDALAEWARGGKDHDWVVGVNYRRSTGNYSFLDTNGTPLNTADDQKVSRQNNEHQLIHPYLKWIYRFDSKTQIQWSHHLFRQDQGVPGVGSFQSRNADLSQTEYLSNLRFKKSGLFKGKVQIENHIYGRWIRSQFSDPAGEIGLGAAQDNENNTYVLGNRFLWRTDVSKNFVLTKAVETQAEWFLPKDYAAAIDVGSTSKRYQVNLLVEPHLYLWDKKIHLYGTGRSLNAIYRINNNDPSLLVPGTFFSRRHENHFTGTAAIAYKPHKNWQLKTSVGRVVRLPQFIEMFGDQGAVLGNAQLGSEKSIKWDVGVAYTRTWKTVLKKIRLEANYFESHVEDLIQFEVAGGFSRASNIGRATLRGAEFSSLVKLTPYLTVNSNYTFQKTRDDINNTGKDLIGRPRHQVNAEVKFAKGPVQLSSTVNYVDRQYLDALNTQVVRHRVIWNANAGYFIKDKVRLGAEVKNITGSQVVDAVGFPLPGRAFFGRVDLYF